MQIEEAYIQVQRLRRLRLRHRLNLNSVWLISASSSFVLNSVFLQMTLQFRLKHINLQNECTYFFNIPQRGYLWLASADTASSYQWLVINNQEHPQSALSWMYKIRLWYWHPMNNILWFLTVWCQNNKQILNRTINKTGRNSTKKKPKKTHIHNLIFI